MYFVNVFIRLNKYRAENNTFGGDSVESYGCRAKKATPLCTRKNHSMVVEKLT